MSAGSVGFCFLRLAPFFLNPDIVHQGGQTPAGDGFPIALCDTLRCEARGDLSPCRAVLVVHTLQLSEIFTYDFCGSRFDPSNGRFLTISFQLLDEITEVFEVDLHGPGNNVRLLKRYFINT